MCVDPQYQPQYGAPQSCGGCSGGQGPGANDHGHHSPGPGNPAAPGNTNHNSNYNANNPGPGNPPAPGNTNTNTNNNYNVNNPGPGNPPAPGNANYNNNYNNNPGPGNPPAPGNANTNNNYNANNPGPGNPPAPGNSNNNNYNANNPGPRNPPAPGNAINPGPGAPAVPNGCVNCCDGSKANATSGACSPESLSNGCTQRICPDVNGDKIGLKYGHCYRFKNPEGKALNKRDHGLQDYVWGGYYADIYQFRICRSTSDCSKGEEISVNSPFVINDQMGRTSKSSPDTLFWVVELPGWHFGNAEFAFSAVKFTARPWVGDSCGICLKGDGKGLGPVCPAGNPGIGFKSNPRYCIPIILEEVPCLEGDGNLERVGGAGEAGEAVNEGEVVHEEL